MKSYVEKLSKKAIVLMVLVMIAAIVIGAACYYTNRAYRWDSVRLSYNPMMNEYIEISRESAEALETYLWNYDYTLKRIDENAESTYGEKALAIEFTSNNIVHHWYLNKNTDSVSYSRTEDGEEVKSYVFEGDDNEIYNAVYTIIAQK